MNASSTSQNNIPTPEDIYQRAKDYQSVLKSRTQETAELRRLPDATIKDFQDLGFFKIIQPKRWGGYEMDPIVFYKVTGTSWRSLHGLCMGIRNSWCA